MGVGFKFLRWLLNVTSKEEFADVFADILLDDEFTTWMVEAKVCHI